MRPPRRRFLQTGAAAAGYFIVNGATAQDPPAWPPALAGGGGAPVHPRRTPAGPGDSGPQPGNAIAHVERGSGGGCRTQEYLLNDGCGEGERESAEKRVEDHEDQAGDNGAPFVAQVGAKAGDGPHGGERLSRAEAKG